MWVSDIQIQIQEVETQSLKKCEFKYLAGEPFPDSGDQALREPDGEPGHRKEEEERGEGGGGGQGGDRPSLSFAHQVCPESF